MQVHVDRDTESSISDVIEGTAVASAHDIVGTGLCNNMSISIGVDIGINIVDIDIDIHVDIHVGIAIVVDTTSAVDYGGGGIDKGNRGVRSNGIIALDAAVAHGNSCSSRLCDRRRQNTTNGRNIGSIRTRRSRRRVVFVVAIITIITRHLKEMFLDAENIDRREERVTPNIHTRVGAAVVVAVVLAR